MAGPSGQRCSTCYFYEKGRPGIAQGETDKCHRFPPVVTVYFDHWCGEWAPRKSEDIPLPEPSGHELKEGGAGKGKGGE